MIYDEDYKLWVNGNSSVSIVTGRVLASEEAEVRSVFSETSGPVLELTQANIQWLLIFRLLMSYIYGAPILDVSRSHTTTQHSR